MNKQGWLVFYFHKIKKPKRWLFSTLIHHYPINITLFIKCMVDRSKHFPQAVYKDEGARWAGYAVMQVHRHKRLRPLSLGIFI